jgi:hypothetical protein
LIEEPGKTLEDETLQTRPEQFRKWFSCSKVMIAMMISSVEDMQTKLSLSPILTGKQNIGRSKNRQQDSQMSEPQQVT